jgi:hypothetical protein
VCKDTLSACSLAVVTAAKITSSDHPSIYLFKKTSQKTPCQCNAFKTNDQTNTPILYGEKGVRGYRQGTRVQSCK